MSVHLFLSGIIEASPLNVVFLEPVVIRAHTLKIPTIRVRLEELQNIDPDNDGAGCFESGQ